MMYRSVLKYSQTDYIVEKSKFITHIKPVDSEKEAKEFIEEIKKKHWNANHNVPIYIIGEDMGIQKFSDDGEPSGTAAFPVLDMLKKKGITNLVIVITRYFCGIKLGKGGLIRAYTQSAKLGLDSSKIIEYNQLVKLQIVYEYTYHGKIENYISGCEEIFDFNTKFDDKVHKEILIPVKNESIVNSIVEITGNKVEINQKSISYYGILNGKVIGEDNV